MFTDDEKPVAPEPEQAPATEEKKPEETPAEEEKPKADAATA